jgi:hypothetical protein
MENAAPLASSAGYGLTCRYIGFDKVIPITREEFEATRRARVVLSIALGIEEKLDIALENLADLERHLLGLAVDHSIFTGQAEHSLSSARRSTNRRLTNYFATARQYIDQVQHDISRAIEPADTGPAQKQISDALSEQYDSRLGYRVIEALRNYAQHRGLPAHAVIFNASRDSSKEVRVRFNVAIYVGVAELKEDGKFKAAVLRELERCANNEGLVSLMPLVREHSDGLNAINATVRRLLADPLKDAAKLFTTLRARAANEFGNDLHGLSAISHDGNGYHIDWEVITDEYVERRQELESKTLDSSRLAHQYVSSG